MHLYYAARAPTYDRVYSILERQADLRYLEDWVPEHFRNRKVLEIACGTGYWTQYIAPAASTMCAVDITGEAIAQARIRAGTSQVKFRVEDAYHLSMPSGMFDAAFAGLWVSHIPRQKLPAFFINLHGLLQTESKVLVIDNSRAQSRDHPITETDEAGNTYQTRVLDNGSEYKVLKNFPTQQDMLLAIEGVGKNSRFQELEHYWTFEFETL